MKISFKYVLIVALAATIFSCKKDNYAPPSITLSGRLMYQGDSIEVEKNQVPFQIFQYGFGRVGPINGTFAENGTYSALLFDGDYKFIIPNGQGPFMVAQTVPGVPDSISISLKGSQTVDIQVTPYYMVRNSNITSSGGNVNATFGLQKIITDANAKDIESVNLYINKTQFVSGGNQIATATMAGADITDMSSIALSVAVPAMTITQDYVFARIGVKIAGVEDLIFSPLIKVQL